MFRHTRELLLAACTLVLVASPAAPAAEEPAKGGLADVFAEVCALGRWTPLWDGKTTAGWHEIGKGKWTIEDGAIVGRHDAAEAEFSHLVTDRTFKDFTVRL